MLIEPRYTVGDVVTIKLVGGDEVIGRCSSDDGAGIELNKPLLVVMGQQGFGLMPYVLTTNPDAKILFALTHVIAAHKTLDQVAKEYVKQTSGLIT